MKRSQFSYMNGRALSHASLQKFRQQNQQSKNDSMTKETFLSKPNVKYYTSSNENSNAVATRLDYKKIQAQLKNQQQLKKKIKVLECELKKKINEHSYLVKLFKTKNTSELSHIDIYLQFRRIEQELESKDEIIKNLKQKIQQYAKQIQDLVDAKKKQENQHTNQIYNFTQITDKCHHKLNYYEKLLSDKDILLKQIRKKYEELVESKEKLQDQLMNIEQSKKNIHDTYKEKIKSLKQDHQRKIEENHNEIETLTLKNREQQEIIRVNMQKSTQKTNQDQKIIKKLQSQIQQLKEGLQQGNNRLSNLTEKYKNLEESTFMHNQTVLNMKKTMKQQEINHKQITDNMAKEINQLKQIIRENECRIQRYMKEVSKLQQKLGEANSTIKVLNFQREDKQLGMDKASSLLQQKEKLLKEKQKVLEQLQSKCIGLQRKTISQDEKIKQLQKQLHSNKQFSTYKSKAQIENYKCIGRLTQLSNQIHGLYSQSNQQKEQVFTNKTKKGYKNKNAQEIQSAQTITECMDMLTKELDNFIKNQYNENVQANKQNKQFIQEIICDIKSIFHAYNSFVQDEELKGATRQYVECLESAQRSAKKSRNRYLSVIMQRLFSIIAIQCYTSQNGMPRKNESKTRLSSKRNLDSLENTSQHWQEPQDQNEGYYEQRVIHRAESKRKLQDNERYKRQRSSKKKINNKTYTQTSEVEAYPIRRLDYGKENMMYRVNRPQIETNKYYNYLSNQELQHTRKNYQSLKRESGIIKERKAETDENISFQDPKKQRRPAPIQAEAIEKKYFR